MRNWLGRRTGEMERVEVMTTWRRRMEINSRRHGVKDRDCER